MNCREALVTAESPQRRGLLFGALRPRARMPALRDGEHLYHAARDVEGLRTFRRIVDSSDHLPIAAEDRFYRVAISEWPFSAVFARLARDTDGNAWDCHLDGQLAVADSRTLLTRYAAAVVTPTSSLSLNMAQSWATQQIRQHVEPIVAERRWQELRDEGASALRWWVDQCEQSLANYGLRLQVTGIAWHSAEAEAAEAEAARQRDLQRIREATQRAREAELRESRAKADYEKQRTQIAGDQQLAEGERLHALQMVETRRRREQIEARAQLTAAEHDAERAALEHELTLARLRRDAAARTQVEETVQRTEERFAQLITQFEAAKTSLDQLAALPDQLLARLSAADPRTAHAAAERLVSAEFGILPETLSNLGYRIDRQALIQGLRDKAQRDGQPIHIRKRELIARDIGTARVKSLPINTSLQFEFTSARAGYVTLLNVGTSGAISVHVPNTFVAPASAKIAADQTHSVPGSHLLSRDDMQRYGLDYLEVGPPGWEHLVVIVSERPLIPAAIMARTNAQIPFASLATPEISDLIETLATEAPDAWSAGTLSFLVG